MEKAKKKDKKPTQDCHWDRRLLLWAPNTRILISIVLCRQTTSLVHQETIAYMTTASKILSTFQSHFRGYYVIFRDGYFLPDLKFLKYSDKLITKKKCWHISAIRRQTKNISLSFHSICHEFKKPTSSKAKNCRICQEQ